jgi:hypothetical protein
LLPSGFLNKTTHAFIFHKRATCFSHLVLLNLIILITAYAGENYNALHYAICSLPDQNTPLNTLFTDTHRKYSPITFQTKLDIAEKHVNL